MSESPGPDMTEGLCRGDSVKDLGWWDPMWLQKRNKTSWLRGQREERWALGSEASSEGRAEARKQSGAGATCWPPCAGTRPFGPPPGLQENCGALKRWVLAHSYSSSAKPKRRLGARTMTASLSPRLLNFPSHFGPVHTEHCPFEVSLLKNTGLLFQRHRVGNWFNCRETMEDDYLGRAGHATPSYVKQTASGRLLYTRGAQLGACDDLEGGMAWGDFHLPLPLEGIYVYMWPIHSTVQQRLTQHCKAMYTPVKKKKS